jgi:DNA invertase Pin-like site-specific DNA recombinase
LFQNPVSKSIGEIRLFLHSLFESETILILHGGFFMLIGYGRVSKEDQNLDAQKDELKAAGCEKIYTDKISGAVDDRTGLDDLLSFARPGDVLVVCRLDRLGRTLKKLILLVEELSAKGIGFKSLRESIDTTTPGGRLVFHVFGALAEFERALISDRTKAGLVAAKARGRCGGRPRLMDENKILQAKALINEKKFSVPEICRSLGVSRGTFYRSLQA